MAALEASAASRAAEIAALGGLLEYIILTQVGRMPHLRPPRRRGTGRDSLLIDPATRANLELTRTSAGRPARQPSVGHRPHRHGAAARGFWPNGSRRRLPIRMPSPARLDEIDFFLAAPSLRSTLQAALKAMPDLERALGRLSLGRGGPRDLAAIRDGLMLCQALGTPPVGASGRHWRIAAEHRCILRHACRCSDAATCRRTRCGALADELPLLARDGGFVRPGYLADLDENRELRDETRQVIAGLQTQYAEDSGIKSLKVKHNNVLGYFIEVTAQHAGALQAPDRPGTFIHRQTVASAMRFVTTELAALEQRIAAAGDRALAMEQEIFATLSARVVDQRDRLAVIAGAIAAIDVASALAELAERNRYVRPRVDASTPSTIRGGRHPVVEAALQRQRAESTFVANDCDLSGDGTQALPAHRSQHGRQVHLSCARTR